MASVLHWPIAVEPTSSGVVDLGRRRQRARRPRRAPRVARSSRSARRPRPARWAPDLHAERREHRVARVGEAVAEAAAAGLAVGVLELDAVDRSPRLSTGNSVARLDEPCLERRRGGHDLEGRARRLRGAEKAMPARAPRISPLRGVERRDRRRSRPASATTAACWSRGVDRRAHALGAGAAARARARACPPRRLAAGAAAQPLLEGLLETALADRPVGREAARVERPALLRPSPAGSSVPAIESAIAHERRACAVGGPLGQHLAVARAAGWPRPAGALTRASALARRRPGNTSRGRPVHRARPRHGQAQRRRGRRPKIRVSTTTGTVTSLPVGSPRGSPRVDAVTVAVAAARR